MKSPDHTPAPAPGNAALLRRLLALTWQYRAGCLRILTLQVLLLAMGIAVLSLTGLGIDFIRHQVEPAARPPHWPFGIVPPAHWTPMAVVTALCGTILLLASLRALFNYIYSVQLSDLLQRNIVVNLRARIYSKMQRLSFRFFDDNASGFETFFLSPASSDWARSVAATENGASARGEPGDVEFIVWELVQNRFINRSSRFAEFLQERACRSLALPDRGVRQAGFRVLVGAYMPAVLVEMGFLSNRDEESRLGDRGYQRQLARAIGDAVLAYARGGDDVTGGGR